MELVLPENQAAYIIVNERVSSAMHTLYDEYGYHLYATH